MGTQDRRTVILTAALGTVGTYGFRRTSMEDIAKAAGISRPALYQHFANKTDIYRGVVEDMMAQALNAARVAMEASGAVEQRVHTALTVSVVAPMRAVENMPHGAELLAMKDEAADLFRKWEDEMITIIADALIAHDDILPDPAEDVGRAIILAVEGMKARGATSDVLAEGCAGIARVAGLAAKAQPARG